MTAVQVKGEEFEGFGFEGGEWMHLRDLKEEKERSLVFSKGKSGFFLVGLGFGEMVVFMEEIVAVAEEYMVVVFVGS